MNKNTTKQVKPKAAKQTASPKRSAKTKTSTAVKPGRPSKAQVAALNQELITAKQQRDDWRKSAKAASWDARTARHEGQLLALAFDKYRESHGTHNFVAPVLFFLLVVVTVMWMFK